MRKIIHVDMDAFYASVEQLDNPELRGKPIAVGGSAERGVVAAASYEARKFGVKSAMSSKIAARMCPELIFIHPRFSRYKEISTQIRSIFSRYTDKIEPLALDEAYLDVTQNKLGLNSATFIAQQIKTDIRTELNLVASAGVSYNKFLAKLASDQDKPDGLYVIEPEATQLFIDQLSIDRFHGVGKATAEKLHEHQIFFGSDLHRFSEEELTNLLGKFGSYLFNIAKGIDNREVQADRERKSIAVENTLENDIFDNTSFEATALEILEVLWNRYQKFEKDGKTLTLKLKYNDFTIQSKSQTVVSNFKQFNELQQIAEQLLEQFNPLPKPIRLIGFQIGNFGEDVEPHQLSLPFK